MITRLIKGLAKLEKIEKCNQISDLSFFNGFASFIFIFYAKIALFQAIKSHIFFILLVEIIQMS